MKTIFVYLGASSGNNPVFKKAVIEFTHEIVAHELTQVYGGSSLGMMGLLARTLKEVGGIAIGVTATHFLHKEKPLDILDELHIVSSKKDKNASTTGRRIYRYAW